MVRVDHSLGRPVRAGGSRASIMVAKRMVALARTVSLIAGAYRRRCSGVQDIFGVPCGNHRYGHRTPGLLGGRAASYHKGLEVFGTALTKLAINLCYV